MSLRLVLLVALVPALGCAHRPPQVTLLDASLSPPSGEARVLHVTFKAGNDNSRALLLRDLHCRLLLDGREVARVHRSPEATLRRHGTQTFSVPLPFQADPLPERYEVRGELTYIIPGPLAEILFDMGLLTPTVELRAEGALQP